MLYLLADNLFELEGLDGRVGAGVDDDGGLTLVRIACVVVAVVGNSCVVVAVVGNCCAVVGNSCAVVAVVGNCCSQCRMCGCAG